DHRAHLRVDLGCQFLIRQVLIVAPLCRHSGTSDSKTTDDHNLAIVLKPEPIEHVGSRLCLPADALGVPLALGVWIEECIKGVVDSGQMSHIDVKEIRSIVVITEQEENSALANPAVRHLLPSEQFDVSIIGI